MTDLENTYPRNYNDFRCIGGECPDSCCIGWEIEIDDETMEKYQAAEGALGKRLRENISEGCFVLNGERCPFLNEKNLCDIILEAGEDMLCRVCTRFPRFSESFGNAAEHGLGLACPHAAEMILSAESFEEYTEYSEGEAPDPDYLLLKKARGKLYEIVRSGKYPLRKRIAALEMAAADMQDCVDFDYDNFGAFIDGFSAEDYLSEEIPPYSYSVRQKVMERIFRIYRGFEMINEGWFELLDSTLRTLSEGYEEKCRRFEQQVIFAEHCYEQMICSYIYRYFSKSYYDGDLYSKVMYGICAYLAVRELDCARLAQKGSFTFEDNVDTAHLYSKEIDHSRENLDMLADAVLSDEVFRRESFFGAL